MRILITNTALDNPGGTEGVVCDLATAWHQRGDQVMVFSPRLGKIAADLRRQGIEVTDDLTTLSGVPDLIHGQHQLETMMAVQFFPETPALFHCHGYQPWQEKPPVHPRILLYLAIGDRTCDFVHQTTGIPSEEIRIVPNHADTKRFALKGSPPPSRPRRALIYNRYLRPHETDMIIAACTDAGFACDPFASLHPPVKDPESILPSYDLVFAVGKSAIEAMASGAAVIICTEMAMGSMVTEDNVEIWRRRNFTAAFDQVPLSADLLKEEIARYDARSTAATTAFVRTHCTMEKFIAEIDKAHADVRERAARVMSYGTEEQRAAEFRHALAVNQLTYTFSGEAHQHRQRAEDLNEALVRLRDEHTRVIEQRDLALAQREAMAHTLAWRLRGWMMQLPLAGGLLDRIGRTFRR